MDPSKTNALKSLMLALTCLFLVGIVVCFGSSEKDGPPQDYDKGKAGEKWRSAKLIGFSPEEDIIVYEVQYLLHGLTSKAVLGFKSRGLREETFSKKWKISYQYNKQYPEKNQVPSSYTIYGYSGHGDKYDKLINKYSIIQVKPSQILYRDSVGEIIVRDRSYFAIIR